MKRSRVLVLLGCLAAAPTAWAADTPAKKGAAVDPDAVAALKNMGAFLRSQNAFSVTAEATTDDLLPSGQKIQFDGVAQLKVRRPNRLRVDVTGDRRTQRIYYDGTNFTILDPRTGYFASFSAPPTLADLVDVAERRYGIDLPLADLFYWGSDKGNSAAIKAAVNLGPSVVKGANCTHYAFREPDVDWQIWIEQGDKPLPRKMVITTLGEKSQPEHEVLLTWDLAPQLTEESFVFTPPPGAQKIDFQPVAAAAGSPKVHPHNGTTGGAQ
jgi:hypothetical protein